MFDDCGSEDEAEVAARALRAEQRRKHFGSYVNSLRHKGFYQLAGRSYRIAATLLCRTLIHQMSFITLCRTSTNICTCFLIGMSSMVRHQHTSIFSNLKH